MVWPQGGPLSTVLAGPRNRERSVHELLDRQQRSPRRCGRMWNGHDRVFAVAIRADRDANGVWIVVECRRRDRRGIGCDQFTLAVGVLFDQSRTDDGAGVTDERERFCGQQQRMSAKLKERGEPLRKRSGTGSVIRTVVVPMQVLAGSTASRCSPRLRAATSSMHSSASRCTSARPVRLPIFSRMLAARSKWPAAAPGSSCAVSRPATRDASAIISSGGSGFAFTACANNAEPSVARPVRPSPSAASNCMRSSRLRSAVRLMCGIDSSAILTPVSAWPMRKSHFT